MWRREKAGREGQSRMNNTQTDYSTEPFFGSCFLFPGNLAALSQATVPPALID